MVKDSWNKVLDNLTKKINPKSYNKYIKSLELKKVENSKYFLSTHTKILKTHIEQKYTKDIQETFFEITGEKIQVQIDVSSNSKLKSKSITDFIDNTIFEKSFEPNPDYKFENFIVGENNKQAFSAAKQICKDINNPILNPLYIFGNPGSGKTHLLHAMAHELFQKKPNINIKYTDISSFISEFRFVVSKKESLEKFKNQYLNYDVLIIDDIQYLTETAIKSQEELLYIFKILHSKKKSIILAANKPIKELSINNDLKSRFMGGIQVEIQSSNFKTKKEILNFHNKKLNLKLKKDSISYIAENISDDIRNMLGLLNDIYLYKTIDSLLFIDLETTISIMKNRSDLKEKIISQEDSIIRKVCSEYKVDAKDVIGKSKKRDFVIPRHICMYLLFEFYNINKTQIGKIFQCKHSTVINAIKSVKNKSKKLPKINQTIEIIKKIYPF